ncbi:symplekin [Chloropicon primus]|uniref:Symplekin n=4 Tax=Chloropicon primus TaxID=1764295 RepID=A0A5B8MAR8_9CHLO|nr:symplekin [Chloropicon primus]UPQ96756.1 symplekin [Chloropicon primus]|eukprot:QDZ17538.1 symplekin [Chloropicon primus]
MGGEGEHKRDQAVEAFNELKLLGSGQEKATKVKELTELLIRVPAARGLLPEFVPELCDLQVETNAVVRKELAAFLEALGGLPTDVLASTGAAAYLPKAVETLGALSRDESEKVGKRALMAGISLFTGIYKACVREHDASQLGACWSALSDLRSSAAGTLDSRTAKGGFKVYACKYLESLVLFLSEEELEKLCTSDPNLYAKFNAGATEAGAAIFNLATTLTSVGGGTPSGGDVPAPVAIVLLSALGAFAKCRPDLYAQGACGLLSKVADALGSEQTAEGLSETKSAALLQTLKQVLLTLVKSDKLRDLETVRETCASSLGKIGFEDAAQQALRSDRSGRASSSSGHSKRSSRHMEASGRPSKQHKGMDELNPKALLQHFTGLVHRIRAILESNDLHDFEGPILSPEATADAVLSNFGLNIGDFVAATETTSDLTPKGGSYARTSAEALMDTNLAAMNLVSSLSKEDIKVMSMESLKRVFASNMDSLAQGEGGDELSIQDKLLSRIVAIILENFWEGDRSYCQKVLDSVVEHILEKMQRDRGHATCMGLFYAVFALGEPFRGVYNALLLKLVKGVRQTLPPHDPALCKLMLEVPVLPQTEIVRFLRDLIIMSSDQEGEEEAVEWATLGLNTLRDLVFERPSLRRACLNLSLSCAMHNNGGLRAKAIKLVADTLYPVTYLQGDIEKFALKALSQLTTASDGVSEGEVSRHMELFFALCTKKHDLLHELLSMFARASQVQKKVMNQNVMSLAKEIPPSSPSVVVVVENPPKGSEILLLLMLHSMAEAATLPKQLVRAVQALYRKTGDSRFIVPIFGYMPKADAIEVLPKFVELPETARKTAVVNAFTSDPEGLSPESLSASELFVRLHLIDEAKHKIPLKKLIECTNMCFQLKSIFTPKVLSISVQHLVQYTPLPKLFMRTVIQTANAAPQLKGFIVQLLARLVAKKIWEDLPQWQGFLMCASKLGAYPVLLQLPTPHLQAAIQRMPDLKLKLNEFVQQDRVTASKLPRTTLQVLGVQQY